MNLLSRLFKSSAPLPSVYHGVFGAMQAVIDYGDGMFYWEVDEPVRTRLGELEPAFDAPVDGPTERQTLEWQQLVEDYSRHFANAEHILRQRMADFDEESDFASLRLTSIDMFGRPSADFEWSFAYEGANSGLIYTVLFREGLPETVTADG